MKYEYKEAQRLAVQYHEMNRLGAKGWKLIDVRHRADEPSWADELLFMREIPEQIEKKRWLHRLCLLTGTSFTGKDGFKYGNHRKA